MKGQLSIKSSIYSQDACALPSGSIYRGLHDTACTMSSAHQFAHECWGWERLAKELTAENDYSGGKLESLRKAGLVSWYQFGSLTERRWQIILKRIPTKRVDHPEDLRDISRYGAGHLHSLDVMRAYAVWDRGKTMNKLKTMKQVVRAYMYMTSENHEQVESHDSGQTRENTCA
jgi:hypothetical protein